MTAQANHEIQNLVHLVLLENEAEVCFKALLILLEKASDSAIIENALGQISPESISNKEYRKEASQLLIDASCIELAKAWNNQDITEVVPTNVIMLDKSSRSLPTAVSQSTSFSDIGGLESVKKQVRRKIISPFQNKRALFDKFKRKAGGGVLMYGPPGCGKTMLARALATECSAKFVEVRPADILDQYVGNAEKKLAQVFKNARENRPTVLFFDEFEALAQRRQFDDALRVNTVVSALLNEMDGFAEDNEGVLFLGATNVPWSIDSAFRRPGRFDRTIFVPPPDKVARKFIINSLLLDRPTEKTLSLKTIVEKTTGFSGADLSALVDTAIDIAIEESTDVESLSPLSDTHFNEAYNEVKSTVGEWLGQAQKYAEYANENGLYDDLADFLNKHGK